MSNSGQTTWTIRVLLNPKEIDEKTSNLGQGSWSKPVGGSKMFGNSILLVATNDKDERVVAGNADSDHFILPVNAGDKIRWVEGDRVPGERMKLAASIYGFQEVDEEKWEEHTTRLSEFIHDDFSAIVASNGFNRESEPTNDYIYRQDFDIGCAQTEAREGSTGVSLKYFLKILLVTHDGLHGRSAHDKVGKHKVVRYIKIDPVLKIK